MRHCMPPLLDYATRVSYSRVRHSRLPSASGESIFLGGVQFNGGRLQNRQDSEPQQDPGRAGSRRASVRPLRPPDGAHPLPRPEKAHVLLPQGSPEQRAGDLRGVRPEHGADRRGPREGSRGGLGCQIPAPLSGASWVLERRFAGGFETRPYGFRPVVWPGGVSCRGGLPGSPPSFSASCCPFVFGFGSSSWSGASVDPSCSPVEGSYWDSGGDGVGGPSSGGSLFGGAFSA